MITIKMKTIAGSGPVETMIVKDNAFAIIGGYPPLATVDRSNPEWVAAREAWVNGRQLSWTPIEKAQGNEAEWIKKAH